MKVLLRNAEVDPPMQGEYSAEIKCEFDNLINLAPAGRILSASTFVTLIGIEANRHFKRVLWELIPYVSAGTKVRICLVESEHLSWFGLKALVYELVGTDWLHRSTVPTGESSIEVEYEVLRPRLRDAKIGWSVGILANGIEESYLDLVRRSLERARAVSAEPIELIVFESESGRYAELAASESGLTTVSADWAADNANISRKKNELVRQASFDKLVVMHDRFLLSPGFFLALQDIGEHFDFAVPRVVTVDGYRGLDWAMVSSANYTWSVGALLSYRDSSRFSYCPGGLTILRRSTWEQFPWNEACSWNEHEDVELSRRFQRSGGVLRWVPATAVALRDRWFRENGSIPLDNRIDVLPSPLCGEQRHLLD